VERSVVADKVRLHVPSNHLLYPELSSANISNLRACMDYASEGNQVDTSAGTLHLTEPMLSAVRCASLGTGIDKAIERSFIWV
jgi:hypothetical protein